MVIDPRVYRIESFRPSSTREIRLSRGFIIAVITVLAIVSAIVSLLLLLRGPPLQRPTCPIPIAIPPAPQLFPSSIFYTLLSNFFFAAPRHFANPCLFNPFEIEFSPFLFIHSFPPFQKISTYSISTMIRGEGKV